jgi:hypothetical protein
VLLAFLDFRNREGLDVVCSSSIAARTRLSLSVVRRVLESLDGEVLSAARNRRGKVETVSIHPGWRANRK